MIYLKPQNNICEPLELHPKYLLMLQIELSSVGISILNFEWVVLPPDNKRDVIPLDATVSTIFL